MDKVLMLLTLLRLQAEYREKAQFYSVKQIQNV